MRIPCSALLLVLVSLSACGGSEEPAQETPKPAPAASGGLTEAQFVAQADALCKKSDEQADTIDKRLDALGSLNLSEQEQYAKVSELLEETQPQQDEFENAFRELRAPATEREFQRKFLITVQDQNALFRRAAEAAESEDAERFNASVEEAEDLVKRRDGLAAGHGGFKHCGDDGE